MCAWQRRTIKLQRSSLWRCKLWKRMWHTWISWCVCICDCFWAVDQGKHHSQANLSPTVETHLLSIKGFFKYYIICLKSHLFICKKIIQAINYTIYSHLNANAFSFWVIFFHSYSFLLFERGVLTNPSWIMIGKKSWWLKAKNIPSYRFTGTIPHDYKIVHQTCNHGTAPLVNIKV